MRTSVLVGVSVCLALLSSLGLRAQTWVGGSNGGAFNTAANWSPASVPSANGDLTFTGPNSNTAISLNLAYTANSLSFTAAAPHYFFNNGGATLSIAGGGLTTASGGGGVDFNFGTTVALTATQSWTTNTAVAINGGTLSGGSNTLNKLGTGSLSLAGNNTLGGLTISAGAVYLGQNSNSDKPAGNAPISVAGGATLGAYNGDLELSNAITVASGATLGGGQNGSGKVQLDGTITLGATSMTLNLGQGETHFDTTSLITGSSGTNLTVASTGLGFGILTGSVSNVTDITADNAALAFATTASLPTNSLQAAHGGYVSIADVGLTTPTVAQFLALITNKAAFNGTIGFDTQESASAAPTFASGIDLSSFTSGLVKLGSATKAILTGAITPPAQSYDFGGYAAQGGALFVQSALTDNGGATSVNISSPSASGGAGQDGLSVVLQGNNTYHGAISAAYAGFVLDSPSALPSGPGYSNTFSLGANAYAGYTENAGYPSFADFVAKMTPGGLNVGYTATSILGIDSHDVISAFASGNFTGVSARTVSDDIDLHNFSSISLGSMTGVTLNGSQIKAPADNVLRLVATGEAAPFTIDTALTDANSHAVVVGAANSEGTVVLNGNNSYAGGTTLAGGTLQVGHNNALGSGTLTVSANSGDGGVLAAATNGITLTNNIAVTDFLTIGTGGFDDSGNYQIDPNGITLNGVVSNVSGGARLFITAPTTLGGTNTYTNGTFVFANTLVANNAGLGNNSNVRVGHNATLTFTSATPSIGSLFDASQFSSLDGTGTINLGPSVTSLTINQGTQGQFSGQFTGTSGPSSAALIKNGLQQLTLLGNNAGQFTGGTTINAGTLAIGNSQASGVTFNSNVALSASGGNNGSLRFSPASGQTISYNGNITTTNGGVGGVTIQGNGSTAIVEITGGSSTFTGSTTVSSGVLLVSADNAWSSASPMTVNSGATLSLNANQTIRNPTGSGTISVAASKKLTVDSSSTTTFSGAINGSGSLEKVGSGTLVLGGAGNGYNGGTTISAGVLQVTNNNNLGNVAGGLVFNGGTLRTGGGMTSSRALTFNTATTGTIDTNGFNSTFSGTLAGSGTLAKTGAGRLTLSSPSGGGFNGSLSVSGGGSMLVTGSALTNINAAVSGSGTQLLGNITLGAVTVNSGAHVGGFNGGSPATLGGSSFALNSGSKLDVFVTNAGGTAGVGYSTLNLTGDLTLSNITIALMSYNSGSPGLATFSTTSNYSFTLASTVNGVLGFNAGSITVDTSGFQNAFGGTWSVALSGNSKNLLLNYAGAAIPEPSVSALLAGLAVSGLAFWRRRKGRA